MSLYAQTMPPKTLAIWVRALRTASDMSQDALAEAAGITERTVQRVEKSGRASKMTRHNLARGLGYENHDIFDDPTFVAMAIDALHETFAKLRKAEEANYPDHVKLPARPVNKGTQIAGLFGLCDAWVYDCDDSASDEGQNASAVLFDNVQDYGDIWSDLPPSARLKASEAFNEMLADIAGHGLHVYQAVRSAHFALMQADQEPMPFKIGYLTVVPSGQAPSHFLVPKSG
jgi:transcriptional regulator with XRE-family HTH domain